MSGYYGFDNIGDESVLAGIAAAVRARCGEDTEILVHSIDPKRTMELHGLNAINRYRFSEIIRSIKESDLLISGGGSLLQDVTSARSILYYLAIIRLARLLGRKTMIYAQGIGPINRTLNRWLTKVVLNGVDAVTVRDDASGANLRNLGVQRPKIEVAADPSFTVEPASEDIVSTMLAAAGIDQGKNLLGVSLRPWPEQERWLPEVCTGIRDATTQLESLPVFLQMHPSLDRDITLTAADTVQESSTIMPASASPGEAKALTGKFGIMVSMRLHALIFAASMGVPGVAICYDPKVREFARTVGIYALDLHTLTAGDITKAILDTWARRQELSETAERHASSMRQLSLKSADIVCELLSGMV